MTSALIERYLAADSRNDAEMLANLRHPDYVAEWPQTGERVRGSANDRLIHSNYPGYPTERQIKRTVQDAGEWALSPMNTLVRVRGEGDVFVGEALFLYPDGPWHTVAIFELKDGKVARETTYWGQPFDPPDWRQGLVEPVTPEARPEASTAPSPGTEAGRRAAIERHFERVGAGQTTAERRELYKQGLRELFHDDAIQDLAQSGERIRSLDNMLKVVDGHPDFPSSGSLRRILTIGDLFVVEARLAYAGGNVAEVMLWEYRGDKVAHSVEYYAPELEAPAWRAQWVERI